MTMKMKRTWRRYKWLYVMLLPGILYYLVFKFGPMFGLLAAFKEYQPMKGFFGSPWVGFEALYPLLFWKFLWANFEKYTADFGIESGFLFSSCRSSSHCY